MIGDILTIVQNLMLGESLSLLVASRRRSKASRISQAKEPHKGGQSGEWHIHMPTDGDRIINKGARALYDYLKLSGSVTDEAHLVKQTLLFGKASLAVMEI